MTYIKVANLTYTERLWDRVASTLQVLTGRTPLCWPICRFCMWVEDRYGLFKIKDGEDA